MKLVKTCSVFLFGMALLFGSFSCKNSTDANNGKNQKNSNNSSQTTEKKKFKVEFSAKDGGTIKAMHKTKKIESGEMIEEGEMVDFFATPDKNMKVKSWSPLAQEDSNNRNHATAKVDKNIKVQVEFESEGSSNKDEVILSYAVEGGNGKLEASVGTPPSPAPESGKKIAKGSLVNFVAIPDKGYEVNKWTGIAEPAGSDKTKNSIVANNNLNVKVSFKLVSPKKVKITKVFVNQKEADMTTKVVVLDDATKITKDLITVKGNVEGEGEVSLTVANISPDNVEPTEEGVDVAITTEQTEKYLSDSVTIKLKKKPSSAPAKKEAEITKVAIDGVEWSGSDPKTIEVEGKNPITKESVKVWGKAKDSSDTPVSLDVESLSPENPVPTVGGFLVRVTTKENDTLLSTYVNFILKIKAKTVKLTTITIRDSSITYDESKNNQSISLSSANKFTKDDINVMGKIGDGATAVNLPIESISPEEITPNADGRAFTIKIKKGDDYASFETHTITAHYELINIKEIKVYKEKERTTLLCTSEEIAGKHTLVYPDSTPVSLKFVTIKFTLNGSKEKVWEFKIKDEEVIPSKDGDGTVVEYNFTYNGQTIPAILYVKSNS